MTDTLTDQAKKIATKFWKYDGGFVFCYKGKPLFDTACNSSILCDEYAFTIYKKSCSLEELTERIRFAMKYHCRAKGMEFVEN